MPSWKGFLLNILDKLRAFIDLFLEATIDVEKISGKCYVVYNVHDKQVEKPDTFYFTDEQGGISFSTNQRICLHFGS